MIYLLIFLVGFGLAVSGGVSIILYLNFVPSGLDWHDYFLFIQSRVECYFLPIGILIMIATINKLPVK